MTCYHFSVQQIFAFNVAFEPRRDWILRDACFAGPVPVATCDVSVACCRRFLVDCSIVVLAEELKKISYSGDLFIALKPF